MENPWVYGIQHLMDQKKIRNFRLVEIFLSPHTIELFTLNNNFSDSKLVLNTNASDFLTQAESIGFIEVDELLHVVQKETTYTSSKSTVLLKNRTMGPWLIWHGFHVKSAGFSGVMKSA